MKLSVSLPDGDVEFVDEYARAHGLGSRSGVLHEALTLLRARELSTDYLAAWDEWAADEDTAAWDATTADGLDVAR
jgi:Arc/MetJ-type ribon-helix-helix transcriptional regulator